MMETHPSPARLATGGLDVKTSLNSWDKLILSKWSTPRQTREQMFLSDCLTSLMLAARYLKQVPNYLLNLASTRWCSYLTGVIAVHINTDRLWNQAQISINLKYDK